MAEHRRERTDPLSELSALEQALYLRRSSMRFLDARFISARRI